MNKVDERRLAQIIRDADSNKERSLDEHDYEEAALWRDAKHMAIEVLECRAQFGDERLTDEQLMEVADRMQWLRPGQIREMAREVLEARSKPDASPSLPSV